MKKLAACILAFAALHVSYANPSYAIFGQSQCEKMEAAVETEQRIGQELWRKYNSDGKALDRAPNTNKSAHSRVAGKLQLVFNSNARVLQLALKNPECFSAVENANIRQAAETLRQARAAIARLKRTYDDDPSGIVRDPLVWAENIPFYPTLDYFKS